MNQTLAEWLPQNESLGLAHCILNMRRLGALTAAEVLSLHEFLWKKKESLTAAIEVAMGI